jgi:hypothetical protein
MPAYCVIRNDRDVFVPERRLTLEEREQIEERKHSPEARRRFGVELRRVRQPEHKAYKAVMKLLEVECTSGI